MGIYGYIMVYMGIYGYIYISHLFMMQKFRRSTKNGARSSEYTLRVTLLDFNPGPDVGSRALPWLAMGQSPLKTQNPGEIYWTGWWFQTFFIFTSVLEIIIPTDELHDFSEG